jgi:thymidylate kinase
MTTSFEISSILNPVQAQDSLRPENADVLPLVKKLCDALETQRIAYCHWKSNDVIERSANGQNDLDLLIHRADAARFTEILAALKFKQAKAPLEKQMPAVLDYYGYDQDVDKFIHVHAHYQLIMGHDMTKNFRLPIETAYIESSIQKNLFRIPETEFEFIVFVVRMILKHSTWDTILGREGKLKTSERRELSYLQERIDQRRVQEILKCHLPYIDADLFANCVKALQPGSSIWARIKAGGQLQKSLQHNAVYPLPLDVLLKIWRRGTLMIRYRLFKPSTKYQLQLGGALIAILGGDGAGKSTAISGLYGWLAKTFQTTRIHMGKPTWSPITVAIRSILKVGQLLHLYPLEASYEETLEQKSLISPGYPFLVREVCRARDRYWTYVKARRFAAKGGLVLLDRFPLPELKLMDGLQTERFIRDLQASPQSRQFLSPHLGSRFAQYLIKLEESYYYGITLPEILTVLRVHPEIAVQRKTDEKPAAVHARSSEIWHLDWDQTRAHVIDASQSKAEVMAELKAWIWSKL